MRRERKARAAGWGTVIALPFLAWAVAAGTADYLHDSPCERPGTQSQKLCAEQK